MSEKVGSSIGRIIGLILMVASVVWIAFNILFTLGLGIAWVAETGLTDELQPWLVVLFLTGTVSAAAGYAMFFVGRWMRDQT
jgi:hypothetical protein